MGQLTKAETKDGSGATVVTYDYTYDAAHRLAGVTDRRGNKSIEYTWTPGGRLSRVVDSDGHSVSYAYDSVGRLSSLSAPNGEHVSFVWDAGGRLIEQRLNSGLRTTQSWYEDGSLKQKTNLFSATTLSNHAYTLDAQGRRATHAETIGGAAKSWNYAYDGLDRLLTASDGTAETYSYDVFGNRRSKTVGGSTTAYLYDLAQQLSEIRSGSDAGSLIGAAVHDADGHLTKLCEGSSATRTASDCTSSGTGATILALAWNALGHLLTATRTGTNAVAESYAYDDSGRRLKKTSAGTTTQYLYDGDDIHTEWATAMTGMPTEVYAHGVGADEPLLRLTGSTNGPAATQTAYLQDGLGSVIGTANAAGTLTANQRFDAWGNKGTSSGTTPTYGFTGREPDQTGLTYYRARYQHPGIGRFVSRDPAGMADTVSPYAYVGNNPVNFVDPMGLKAQIALPGNQSASPADQLAFCLPCLQATAATITDVAAGIIGGAGATRPGNQSLNGGRGSGGDDALAGLGLGVGAAARNISSSSSGNDDEGKVYVTYTRTNLINRIVYSGQSSGYGDPQQIVNARMLDPDHQLKSSLGFGPGILDNSSLNNHLMSS